MPSRWLGMQKLSEERRRSVIGGFQVRDLSRAAGALAAALVLLVLFATALAPSARAATFEYGSGDLDWGVKTSFRNYIKGGGLIETSGGASENLDGTFRFPIHAGSYDDVSGAGSISAGGSVRFTAHAGALDMTISNPVFEFDGDGGVLRVHVGSKKNSGGVICEQVELVEYAPTPSPAVVGPPLELDTALGDLTATGVPVFDPFYTVGEDMDAVSISAATGTPGPAPAPPACPKEEPTDPGDPNDPGTPTDPGTSGQTPDGGGQSSTPETTNPTVTTTPQTPNKPKRCKKGFRKVNVKGKPGKTRCVKKKQAKGKKGKSTKPKAAKRRASR